MVLRPEKRERLQPNRMAHALKKLSAVPGVVSVTQMSDSTIRFNWKGSFCLFYPFTGWATGKTITDGRGLDNLLKQLV